VTVGLTHPVDNTTLLERLGVLLVAGREEESVEERRTSRLDGEVRLDDTGGVRISDLDTRWAAKTSVSTR